MSYNKIETATNKKIVRRSANMFVAREIRLRPESSVYAQWTELMQKSGLNTKENLDYTVGIFDGDQLVATGSYADNILKCLAVDEAYQSENFLLQLIVHLMGKLQATGKYHYFVYTKADSAKYFESMGFQTIAQTPDVHFMEFGTPNLSDYIQELAKHRIEEPKGKISAIVMNANPFTLGHRYLIEQAAAASEHLYVFVVSEDRSEFRTEERQRLVEEGTTDLKHVTVLPTCDYMVSQATFPSYFLKDDAEYEVAAVQATLDATLFRDKIAPALAITDRFVGEEKYSKVTDIYNETMALVFGNRLSLHILPRKEVEGDVISATRVRKHIADGRLELTKDLVPDTTYQYIIEKYAPMN